MTRLEKELDLATDLARRAGEVVLKHYKVRGELEVDSKAGNEPVTRADRESEALILEGLRRAFPDDGILAEESREQSFWRERTWIVDPLDGTKDFIEGWDGFSVMIGLLQEGRPVLGVIHQPRTECTFRAICGSGSGAAEMLEGERILLLAPSQQSEVERLRLVVSNTHRSPRIDQIKERLGIQRESRVGSVGVKISLVARALQDLYVHPTGHCKLWDTCAPEAVLTAAGGRMTDLYGAPIQYDPDQILVSRGILASNGVCHEQVVQRIAPLFENGLS